VSFYVGVDIGGTFTDCVAVHDDGSVFHAKALSTKTDPADGVVNGLAALASEAGVGLDHLLAQTRRFSHGTTIGTNLVAERKGARTGLICTAGTGDTLLMMRGAGRTAGVAIERVYDVKGTSKPEPIVPRSRILELDERVDRNGAVVVSLDRDRTRQIVADWLSKHELEAVAICLLWGFRNPAHEQAVASIVRDLDPGLFVSVASDVSPRLGEYERTVATVINGYVGPGSSSYLGSLCKRLDAKGLAEPVLVMQSNGGVVPVSAVQRTPLTILDSGPTGGLVGTAALAKMLGHDHVIATDMGGTTFDVGLVIDGQPLVSSEQVLNQYAFNLPHIDVRSIACGGGSIARADLLTRSIRVGPHSAGSEPGPACYGRGGLLPTVTDADVVLGLLRPDSFLAGRMPLDAVASRRAVGALADAVGLSIEATAAGIVSINNASAALLIRQRTVEHGRDPRDFTIYAFGGAGPVHAFGYAAELGVSRVVVPLGNGASTLSAYGIASADAVRYVETECELRSPFNPETLSALVRRCEAEARASLARDGFEASEFERTALMRYAGQNLQSLPVRLPSGDLGPDGAKILVTEFERNYERLFGAGSKVVFQAVELFTIRMKATAALAFAPSTTGQARSTVGEAQYGDVFWPTTMKRERTHFVDGASLSSRQSIDGPALIELPHTTIAVAPGQTAVFDRFGNIVLSL
jgi:N-methylhydantoinase A